MEEYEDHYEDLIIWLVKNHAHKHNKIRIFMIKKGICNGLDYDEIEDLLIEATSKFGFLIQRDKVVWLKQNRGLLSYLEDSSANLSFLSAHLDHITPPELREEFSIPTPQR